MGLAAHLGHCDLASYFHRLATRGPLLVVREILVRVAKSGLGLSLHLGWGGRYVLVCRFGGNSETASSQKGPFGKLSGFGRDNHFGGLLKGRGGS